MPLPAIAAALGSLTAKIGLDTAGFVGSLGKAAGKVKEFGANVQKSLEKAKENVLPLWAGMQLMGQSFSLLFGQSEVLNDIFGVFQDILGALADTVLASLMPAIQPLIDILVSLLNWVAGLPEPIKQFMGVMILAVPVIFAVSAAIIVLEAAGGPLILIILGIMAAIAAIIFIWQNWGAIVKWFSGIFGPIVDWLMGVPNAIMGGWNSLVDFFVGLGKSIANGLIGGVEWALNWIVDTINGLFGWTGLSLPHINLPRLDKGGMIEKSGLAVVHKGEWFSGVGEGSAGGGGGGSVYHVTIPIQNFYGTEQHAQELVKYIQEILRQRGMSAVNTLR